MRTSLLLLAAILLPFGRHASAQARVNVGGIYGAGDPARWIHAMNAPDNFTYPFRIIQRGGTNTYTDLRAHFAYYQRRGRDVAPSTSGPPAKAWKFLRGEIAQVHDHGLLLTKFNYNSDGDRRYNGDSFALTNYPGWQNLTDRQTVKCFALAIGTLKFEDYRGITRTVPLYDHGIPYDPYALARSNKLSRANAPPPTNFVGAIK
jgi:hypothetical protein